jgi:hypothetical protein
MGGAHEVGSRPFMPASTLNKRSGALPGIGPVEAALLQWTVAFHGPADNERRADLPAFERANLSCYFFFWNVSRPET